MEDEYAWTISNYGGKWGDWYTSTKHMHRSNKAVYVFDSAWSPLLTLAERINELLDREVSLNFWSIDNMNEGLITWSRDNELIDDEYFVDKKLFPNVDFYSGIILEAMGFPTSMFTPIFALSRTVGWISQWKEMIADPQVKIGRPRQLYLGETPRDYVDIEKR